ncbi:EAL domain-containing response regulator [Vibrio hyugaensis]|uniref:EAL domain-containing response regulator n=1 Tax=Vibrio hyugaensis TaxID=1534743 RepID=UPI0005EDE1B0|nr:EAL domain-containing response regulator [Vibrio hyugaensis]
MNKPLKAMVIDDHPLQITLLRQMLLRNGVDVVTFDNADSAIAYAKDVYIDIIFCDLQMPEKDGIDMMEMLDHIDYQGNVVLVSAMELSIVTAVRAMCETFSFEVLGKLLKPYEEQQVIDMLTLARREPEKVSQFDQCFDVQDQEFLLALREGRIKNYYQPLADAHTGEIIGYEALARWFHPTHGVLPPDSFLSIVERCHLSADLFDAVFSNALNDIKHHGLNQKISINVDHDNLEDCDFASQFIQRCCENGISPDRFTIEITERDTFQTSAALYKNLLKFRMSGVTVSIDDFGTGSSSLEKLAQLPFNELKIDRSFIQGLVNDPKKKNIVLAICALAKSLNISVVAEGVEDEVTLQTMRQYTIDVFQGYYIDKPMPLEAITILN